MRMTRALVIALLGMLSVAAPVAADTDVPPEQACADFEAENPADQDPSSAAYFEGTVRALLYTAGASCRNAKFTLYILDSDGVTLLATQTVHGNGEKNYVTFKVNNISGTNDEVCVYAESIRRNTVVDRAPDNGCVPLFLDESPGSGSTFK